MDCIRAQLCLCITLAATGVSSLGCKPPLPTSPGVLAREPNELLWGDTHVHVDGQTGAQEGDGRSVDADTAYRFAQGLPVVNPSTRARVQLQRPLDFLVVAHFVEGLDEAGWGSAIEAAERFYKPCAFTTFIGWEWSSEPDGNNLHRVVFMNQGAEQAHDFVPFSGLDGSRPEELWSWLAQTNSRLGVDFIAIPHGPNLSGGMMYPKRDSDGAPMTAEHAEMRMRWEPVSEVTQIRGDSETHPALSSDDEFADFERYLPATEENRGKPDISAGAYARTALLRGLQIGRSVEINPFQFGMIGSTGADTGLASADENFFWGAAPPLPVSEVEGLAVSPGPDIGDLSAQGLAAVWAEENTRASIFDAFKRKEVYATTGPRMRVRFFGGWEFDSKQALKPDMVRVGYTFGRPMGSELPPRPESRKAKTPGFLMYAVKDPEGANLDRIQLVKGWVDEGGKTHEKVYDVVWSGGRQPGPDGKLPPVQDVVDLRTARSVDIEGAPTLQAFWSDPEFDPAQPAFYYLRVLQVPTPRHSLYDAIARGLDPKETGHPPTIQERAYTSPIWYTP
jgi:hypothetical protein